MEGDIGRGTALKPEAVGIHSELREVTDRVAESLAPSTRWACGAGLASFQAWCEGQGVEALRATPETVARYQTAGASES